MKKALVLTMAVVLCLGLVGFADIQNRYDPDDDGEELWFGDGNELVFGAGDDASLVWEDGDANANYLLLELPAGGAVNVPVFGIGITLDDEDLDLYNGITQPTFAVMDADADSSVYLSFSEDDVGLLAGKGSATSFGITFATLTSTASTLAVTYSPDFRIGFDSGSYMKFAVADTSGSVTVTQVGGTKAYTHTAAGGFSYVGDFDVTGAISGTSFTGLEIGVDVQAYDAELAALAALTFADDKIILGTGAGTIAMADCSAYAQTILDDADEATFKATVNLEPGTDVQAYDAELAALAGLTFADDKIILGTGAGTVSTADCSAYVQTILDDADEATFKATVNLEAGTDVQGWDADLDTFATLTPTANAQTLLESTNFLSMTQDLSVEIGVDTQAYDAELAALAALTFADDQFILGTGVGTVAMTSCTAFAQSILDDADEATFKATVNAEAGTDFVAWDAELDTLAALTFADDQFILGTGAGTVGMTSCTVFAQSILDDADEATFKATVNLEAGTDVEAWDAELDALAAMTFADDKIILGTGAGTIAMADCSAYAQTVLDDADEATFKATVNLEIGTDVQAQDDELDDIAGLTFADDKIIIGTGAGTIETIDCTATAQMGLQYGNNPVVLNHRHRVTIAEINAGHEVLPAIAGRTYRVIDVVAIAYGGAAGTVTTVDVLGTQAAGGVKLFTFAQADLTQSAVLTLADATVQADGASFTACDAASAITIGKTGGDIDTATGVDFIITYVIE